MEQVSGNYEEMPMEYTEDSKAGKIIKKKKIQRMTAYTKPTFMLLCEKYQGVATQIKFNQSGPSHQPVFTAELDLDGQKFIASGASKKVARLLLAEKAVEFFKLREDAHLAYKNDFANDDMIGSTDLAEQQMADTTFGAGAEQIPEPVGKNSISILVFLRPGINFAIDQGEKTVKCSVTVDGVRFEHEAINKKLARAIVASLALSSLFGLQFAVNSAGMPIFVGQDEEWQQFKAESKPVKIPSICESKNPIQFIHELFPNTEYDEVNEEQSIEEFGHRFTVSLNIEGVRYIGSGNTKKIAKLTCSISAIEGLLEKRILPNLLNQKKLNKKTSKYNIPAWYEKGKPGAAAIRLAIHFPSIQYNLISQTPNPDGSTLYSVGAVVKNEYYTGSGNSIAFARDNLAEIVLNKLGLAIQAPMDQMGGGGAKVWSGIRGRGRGRTPGVAQAQRQGLGYTTLDQKPIGRGASQGMQMQQQFRSFKSGGVYDPSKAMTQYAEPSPYPPVYTQQTYDFGSQPTAQSQYSSQGAYYQQY